ncbi:response regulator transcription factor [Actinopolymorpha rutila]|uniref:Two-component system response regulator QseB n=1 Tax=Actinopolymorpha rutila TaxID=446787 RepID=A0A852ZY14_9ACTN|nr:two-component system response regulator QseB [Actinopolymorpha rutila]
MCPSDAFGPARLLLVEDDQALAAMLADLLSEEEYAVDLAPDGQRGLHRALSREYDVIVVDRGLPGIDGLDLLVRLRSSGVATPVLVLSALGTPADRVEGLDAGAEDYLAKPFDVAEFLARLRALRRRHLDQARLLPVGGEVLNLDTREVGRAQLSERECDLLAALASRPGHVFSRTELLARVFPGAEGEVVVDTYVHYLRRKLGRAIVTTVRGRGYRLGEASS